MATIFLITIKNNCCEIIQNFKYTIKHNLTKKESIKFLFILSPKCVWSIWVGGTACFLGSSTSENYVDVGYYIFVNFLLL